MRKCNVVFKGTVEGLIIVMNEKDDFKCIYQQIEKKLVSSGKFFKGASMIVKYRGKELTDNEEEMLLKLMIQKTNAEIKCFEKYDAEAVIKKSFFKGVEEGITKYFRGTVRSGQHISYNGNVVVLGDVNAGGKVEAAGNVIILGALRGTVHAGADGNKQAFIAAFDLQPVQLRIAEIITRCPDEKGVSNARGPELAFINDDAVIIDTFLPQKGN